MYVNSFTCVSNVPLKLFTVVIVFFFSFCASIWILSVDNFFTLANPSCTISNLLLNSPVGFFISIVKFPFCSFT